MQSVGSGHGGLRTLPFSKRLMDLTVFVEQTVSRFPRSYKYSLGSELRAICYQALGPAVDANSALMDGAVRCSHGAGVRRMGQQAGERPLRSTIYNGSAAVESGAAIPACFGGDRYFSGLMGFLGFAATTLELNIGT
jgi:hypothetical protein